MQRRHNYPIGSFNHAAEQIEIPAPSLTSVFWEIHAKYPRELLEEDDKKTLRRLSKLRAEDAPSYELECFTGIICFNNGNYSDALATLESAMGRRETPEALYSAGETALKLGEYTLARDYLTRSLSEADK